MKLTDVLFEIRDGVGYITLNRPKKMNPISISVVHELLQCVEACESPDVRAVVFRGAGGNFSGGGDISTMKDSIGAETSTAYEDARLIGTLPIKIRQLRKPTIAWVEGAVAGGGMGIIMACDFIYAQEESKMVFAFVNVGLVPDTGAAYTVTRTLGYVRATELFMSGRAFSGKEAFEMGLITKAVPAAELEEVVTKQIRKLANGPTTTYGNIKEMINRAILANMEGDGLDAEAELQEACMKTSDFRESVMAFLEKRKPILTGK